MTQHSVTPWRDEAGTIFGADDTIVCEVHGGDGRRFIDDEDNAECLANKRLILAAPQMLEALQEALSQLDEDNAETKINSRYAHLWAVVAAATNP